MAGTTATLIPERSLPPSSDKESTPTSIWQWLALVAIMLISAWMNCYQLGQNGFGNLFYAAGVRSMLDSWHNFFFVSYDPGGFVTVDKPALGFWLQALSAKLFGFTPFSIFFPQALSGILAVLLLFYLVKRRFGVTAGLLAALFLALSPISVVTNRNNTIDSTLALVLLLGAWAVLRAAETGRLRWLLLSALFVGLGFNVKMTEAYLVIPAYGALYLFAAPRKIWTRIGHLLLALVVLLVVSFSWALAVDLTPASQRPYVGSSQDNSEIGLAIGYNGINRLGALLGRGGRGGFPGNGDGNRNRTQNTTGTTSSGNTAARNTTGSGSSQSTGGFAPPAGSTRSTDTGNTGNIGPNGNTNRARQDGGGFGAGGARNNLLSLFNGTLAGQTAWFIPLAFFGLLALAVLRRPNFQTDPQQQSMLFWGMWFLTMAIFFSLNNPLHEYYMTEMSPGIAALAGIGLVIMWRYYCLSGWRAWLLPLSLAVTAIIQIHILQSYPQWNWLIPLLVVLVGLSVLILVVARFLPRLNVSSAGARMLLPALAAGVLVLLIGPTIWSALPVLANEENSSPTAGPVQNGTFGGGQHNNGFPGAGFGNTNGGTSTALIQYLEANQGSTRFLVATPSSQSADGIILATNKPVMALGGFSGNDPILTTAQLQALINNGTIRFFLLNSVQSTGRSLEDIPEQYRGAVGGFFGGRQNGLSNWVMQHCSVVPASAWQGQSGTSGSSRSLGASQLYDCSVLK